jgi:hypothetical protein
MNQAAIEFNPVPVAYFLAEGGWLVVDQDAASLDPFFDLAARSHACAGKRLLQPLRFSATIARGTRAATIGTPAAACVVIRPTRF